MGGPMGGPGGFGDPFGGPMGGPMGFGPDPYGGPMGFGPDPYGGPMGPMGGPMGPMGGPMMGFGPDPYAKGPMETYFFDDPSLYDYYYDEIEAGGLSAESIQTTDQTFTGTNNVDSINKSSHLMHGNLMVIVEMIH